MTWQKVAPIYLIIFSNKLILLLRAILSIVMGTIMQYKNNNLRLLMSYSSISNTCWIVTGVLLNLFIILMFILIYFLSVIVINFIFKTRTLIKSSGFKKTLNLYSVFLFILLLRGIPPTIAFVPK